MTPPCDVLILSFPNLILFSRAQQRAAQPEASVHLVFFLCCSQIMDDSGPRSGRTAFAWLVGASQVLGLTSVVLTGVWMGHYRGGFAWDGSAQEFNLHPLCMVLGLVFLHGDGKLILRLDKVLLLRPTMAIC